MFVISSFPLALAVANRRATIMSSISTSRLFSSIDEEGRRMRRRNTDENSSSDGGSSSSSSSSSRINNGWDDFDPLAATTPSTRQTYTKDADDGGPWGGNTSERRTYNKDSRQSGGSSYNSDRNSGSQRRREDSFSSSRRSSNGRPPQRRDQGDRSYDRDSGNRRSISGNNNNRRSDFRSTADQQEKDQRRTNLAALAKAGFVHLYGLAPVLNALQANKRDFTRPEDLIDLGELSGEALEHELAQRARKPEAQYSPWLFVQDNSRSISSSTSSRSGVKSLQADRILALAAERNIPVATVDKGVLNTLSGERPHQGYVLRCGPLEFETLNRIPLSSDDHESQTQQQPLWLVLDEVVDPQNLGALLRSVQFLGQRHLNVLVCAKNSAPPSPTVSAASAGALEVLNVYATNSLPKTLSQAEQDGFRIIGASSSVPRDSEGIELYDLQELPPLAGPTLLVLGSEGHGLRQLVSRCCTEFVRIPGGIEEGGVDSLNVSVTGGILLWHLLQPMYKTANV
ncbi:hypothetical protein MPSEU_001028100 [Mayamaea pseudoterrestris]|nr:hypothetical protein MPSEU_001028100 [Mayamaea pseudoterrestris]